MYHDCESLKQFSQLIYSISMDTEIQKAMADSTRLRKVAKALNSFPSFSNVHLNFHIRSTFSQLFTCSYFLLYSDHLWDTYWQQAIKLDITSIVIVIKPEYSMIPFFKRSKTLKHTESWAHQKGVCTIIAPALLNQNYWIWTKGITQTLLSVNFTFDQKNRDVIKLNLSFDT